MVEWRPFGQKSLDFIRRPIAQDARINILEGSVRSSKTITMIPKWLRYIKQAPPGLLLMTGVSKDTVYDNVLRDLFDTVGSSNYRYNRQNGELRMYGRDLKVIGAKDEGAEKFLRGKTLAGAYSDEGTLLPQTFFKQLLNRLSVPGARLYMTTNPDTPSHYLYTEYITDEKQLACGAVDVTHFELDDNPNLDEEYKTFIRGAYAGLYYKRFIQGLWVMAEGSIYDMWDEANIYDELPVPKGVFASAVRDISIDYGTTNPMVFLDIYDTGDLVLIDREYYYDSKKAGRQKTDSEYADDFDKFTGGPENVRWVIIDPSAASFRIELRHRGYRVKEADNEVLDGIRLTSTLIAKRIIRVHRRCVNLIREIGSYVWDTKKSEAGKEQPVKRDDHGPDAKRYWVKTIFKPYRLMRDDNVA